MKSHGELVDLGPVPGWLVIDAVRYAVGRRSTQPETTSRWLVGAWPHLPDAVRDIIRQDLENEFRRDDAARARREDRDYFPLGDDCDRQAWERVRALWQGQERLA